MFELLNLKYVFPMKKTKINLYIYIVLYGFIIINIIDNKETEYCDPNKNPKGVDTPLLYKCKYIHYLTFAKV